MSGKPGATGSGDGNSSRSSRTSATPSASNSASRSTEKPASKKDERRIRNLQSANVSRQRRREMISSLTEEKARLEEANALLRSRLSVTPGILPPLVSVEGGSASGSSDVAQLGTAMQELLRRKTVEGKAAVDLLDRALGGGRGKDAPLDKEAAELFRSAAKRAPKDVRRPVQYYTGDPSKKSSSGSRGAGSKSKSSSAKSSSKASGSKGKGKR